MIFTPENCEKVLAGTKTMTRRVRKPDDSVGERWTADMPAPVITRVYGKGGNILRWVVGQEYAIQPGRGKKAVGRIRITEIRREKLQDVSTQDIQREGVRLSLPHLEPSSLIYWGEHMDAWKALWDSLYGNDPVKGWEANPDVWCITFVLVTNDD